MRNAKVLLDRLSTRAARIENARLPFFAPGLVPAVVTPFGGGSSIRSSGSERSVFF